MFVGRGKQIAGKARVKEKWDLLKLIHSEYWSKRALLFIES